MDYPDKKIAIFDLDNCISNDGWRIPSIKWDKTNIWERYHNYHRKCYYDEFCNKEVMKEHVDQGHQIAILTARPVEYSGITRNWLQRNKINPEYVYFREAGCHLHSKDLKEQQLKLFEHMLSLYEYKTEIVAAYDDREDVIKMYRDNGISCARVLKIHDVCAYTPPLDIPSSFYNSKGKD